MTIYILDNDPKKIAESLDNRSLDKMIKAIAQVLCNVHWTQPIDKMSYKIPLMSVNSDKCIWSQWARECVENYKYLVELGLTLDREWENRFSFKYATVTKHHKLFKALLWARDNVPGLPEVGDYGYVGSFSITQIPLVIPRRHIKNVEITNPEKCGHIENYVYAYRNYYLDKLKKGIENKLSKECTEHDCCIYAKKGYCIKENIKPLWARRNKPDWLSI